MNLKVVAMERQHWPAVTRIYAAGIATGHATFEHQPPTWDQFDASRLSDHRLIALAGNQVVGWAAASPVSSRRVYAGVAEHSIYVAPQAQGAGLGRALLDELIASTEAAGIWTIQSGIFPENLASLALHRAAGFRVVGTRERIGKMEYGPMKDLWRDVVLIERRSPIEDRPETGAPPMP